MINYRKIIFWLIGMRLSSFAVDYAVFDYWTPVRSVVTAVGLLAIWVLWPWREAARRRRHAYVVEQTNQVMDGLINAQHMRAIRDQNATATGRAITAEENARMAAAIAYQPQLTETRVWFDPPAKRDFETDPPVYGWMEKEGKPNDRRRD